MSLNNKKNTLQVAHFGNLWYRFSCKLVWVNFNFLGLARGLNKKKVILHIAYEKVILVFLQGLR